MNNGIRYLIFLLTVAAIMFIGTILVRKRDRKLIEEKMVQIGGVMTSCVAKKGYSKVGPFTWVGKYQTVYYIEYYMSDEETKYVWVKFGLWGEPEWRL